MAKRNLKPIESNRLRLRPLRENDLELTRKWRNQPETRSQFFFDQVITSQMHAAWHQSYMAKDDDFVFIFETKADNIPIGQSALYAVCQNSKTAEFGRFMLGDTQKRSLGFGTEALRLTCQLGFSQLALERIVLEVKPNNLAAIAVYEKTGFVQRSCEPHMLKMELNVTQWMPDANPLSDEIS